MNSLQLYNLMAYFGQKPEGDGKASEQSQVSTKSKSNEQ